LRGVLTPEAARTVDDNLPVLADGTRTPVDRREVLLALSGVVAALGAAATPVMDLIRGMLGLLGLLGA
jgi:hypothetical protein